MGQRLPGVKAQRAARFKRENALKRFAKPSAHLSTNWALMKKGKCMRRTTSFAGIQITEASDEEKDADEGKESNQGTNRNTMPESNTLRASDNPEV